jgi:hypothetical protein
MRWRKRKEGRQAAAGAVWRGHRLAWRGATCDGDHFLSTLRRPAVRAAGKRTDLMLEGSITLPRGPWGAATDFCAAGGEGKDEAHVSAPRVRRGNQRCRRPMLHGRKLMLLHRVC